MVANAPLDLAAHPAARAGRLATGLTRPPPWRMEQPGGLHQVKHSGLPKVDWAFTFAAAAYNLVRMRKLLTEVPA